MVLRTHKKHSSLFYFHTKITHETIRKYFWCICPVELHSGRSGQLEFWLIQSVKQLAQNMCPQGAVIAPWRYWNWHITQLNVGILKFLRRSSTSRSCNSSRCFWGVDSCGGCSTSWSSIISSISSSDSYIKMSKPSLSINAFGGGVGGDIDNGTYNSS